MNPARRLDRRTRGGLPQRSMHRERGRRTRGHGRGHAAWIASACLLLLATTSVRADPLRGEVRPPTRDADRVVTTVAGEADASATVQNPANLGYLRAFGAIVDVAWWNAQARRRGSGVGAFVALPIAKVAALGAGVQWIAPRQPESGTGSTPLSTADLPYAKTTLSLSVPLMRWARGLSVGAGVSTLISRQNPWADGVWAVDVGVSWWAHRTVALGFVARSLNLPRMSFESGDPAALDTQVRLPVVLDPEIALRPIAGRELEIAVGTRISTAQTSQQRFNEWTFQPRARLLAGHRGVRVFAEIERSAYLVAGAPIDSLRLNAGLQIDLRRVGFAGGVLSTASQEASGLAGGVGRLRYSNARYPSAFKLPPRVVTRMVAGSYRGDRGAWRWVRAIERLSNERASAILIETAGLSLGWAQVEEVREAIRKARARGTKVAVYMDGGSLRSWFLACAADTVIAHPQSDLSVLGMSLRVLYYGELLEKLGVRAEFVRIAEYKGTPEIYGERTASGPVARQRRQLLDDTWSHVLRLTARDRGRETHVVAGWMDEGPWTPARALELGAVDALAWPDELDAALERWLGRAVRIEKARERPVHRDEFGERPGVAIVFIEGDLVTGPSVTIPIVGIKLAGSETIAKAITDVGKRPTIRALVVRVDSRGGSVRAAEEISRALDRVADEKPVIISMGNVAASGGYYVATSGSYIFADATTNTGSIGIFYPKFDLSGLLARLGVGVDITSHGAHAAMRSWFKPYSDDERAAAQASIAASYEVFVSRVRAARDLDEAGVDAAARGRVWSGMRAIEVGLVDHYGGLADAVARAQRLAGVPSQRSSIVEVPAPPTLFQQIRALMGLPLSLPIGAGGDDALAELRARRGGQGARGLVDGDGVGSTWDAHSLGGLGIRGPQTPWADGAVVAILAQLPAALWFEEPQALALVGEVWTVE